MTNTFATSQKPLVICHHMFPASTKLAYYVTRPQLNAIALRKGFSWHHYCKLNSIPLKACWRKDKALSIFPSIHLEIENGFWKSYPIPVLLLLNSWKFAEIVESLDLISQAVGPYPMPNPFPIFKLDYSMKNHNSNWKHSQNTTTIVEPLQHISA